MGGTGSSCHRDAYDLHVNFGDVCARKCSAVPFAVPISGHVTAFLFCRLVGAIGHDLQTRTGNRDMGQVSYRCPDASQGLRMQLALALKTTQKPHKCPRLSSAEQGRRVPYSRQNTGFSGYGRPITGVEEGLKSHRFRQ